MNLPKSIAVTCSVLIALALSGNGSSALAAETRSGYKTFADWCREKAASSQETKHTVEVLLKKAGTTECDAVDRKLSSLRGLDLRFSQISDIKPLESLTNLTELDLYNNPISDIKPLEFLTQLNWLTLSNNQISDIKPLESLTNLTVFGLNNNQISDLKPLESLMKLTELSLSGNPIAPKTCPLKPESICSWEPQFVPPPINLEPQTKQ
jgi:internalin A